MIKPARAVDSLTAYRPPLGQRVGLRFDFNENTSGCSPKVLAALRGLSAANLSIYPDRAAGERLLADHLRLDPAQLLLTNGVDEAIHLTCETFLEHRDEVIIPVPTFAMYEIYARATGATVSLIPFDRDFEFPLRAVRESVSSRTKLIVLANPNNPTGTIAPNEALVQIAEHAPDTLLLVDEAYFDFYGQTMLNELSRLPNLLVARTFSKAYGLAGLRLGAIAGNASHIEAMRRGASPYNVNGVALACLQSALEDIEFIRNYVAEVQQGRSALESLLRELKIHFWPSHANFVLTRFGDRHEEFVNAMRERGILVRDRDRDPGCAGCVRISLGTTAQNDVLFTALRQVINSVCQ